MAYTANLQVPRYSGAMLAANQKPDIDTVLRLIEPYQTPILQYMYFSGKSSKAVRNQAAKFDWFEDELLPHQAPILSAEALAGLTIVAEPADIDITMFKLGDLLYIESYDQMAFVSAQTVGSSITISPIDESTTLTAWVAADIGTYVKVVGSTFDEYTGVPLALSTEEVQVYNRLTLFSESVRSSGRQQAGDSWTDGTTHDEQVAKKMKEMKLQYERLFIYSKWPSGDDGIVTTSSVQRTYGKGLIGFITTNAQSYSGAVTETVWDAYLSDVLSKGSDQRVHYCGNEQFMDIQKIVKDKLGSFPPVQKNAYGVRFHTYIHGMGDIEIVRHPLLDGKFTNWGFTVEKKNLIPRHMANDKKGSRKFRIEANVETPGLDGTWTKLLADIGLQFPNQETAGYLYQT